MTVYTTLQETGLAGAGREAGPRIGGEIITCRLADRPPGNGGELVVTVLDPPYFGSDGNAVLPAPAEGAAARPEQAHR